MMKIKIERLYKKDTYTIGKLYIDGEYFCDACEDKDRGLTDTMSVKEIQNIKVYGETAIPTGVYKAEVTFSPKFNRNLLLIKNVKGFEGIRVHSGNFAEKDSMGCILVGKNKIKGGLLESKVTLEAFMTKIEGQKDIEVEIV